MKKFVVLLVLLMTIAAFSGCGDSEYERAGKEFGSWVNKGPSKWTNTQKEYFNDFMDWADKN